MRMKLFSIFKRERDLGGILPLRRGLLLSLRLVLPTRMTTQLTLVVIQDLFALRVGVLTHLGLSRAKLDVLLLLMLIMKGLFPLLGPVRLSLLPPCSLPPFLIGILSYWVRIQMYAFQILGCLRVK